jgi:hypothetical protein
MTAEIDPDATSRWPPSAAMPTDAAALAVAINRGRAAKVVLRFVALSGPPQIDDTLVGPQYE